MNNTGKQQEDINNTDKHESVAICTAEKFLLSF